MKYVPGPMFGQFSGSQGNTTASHNKFGSYTRNRIIPVDPRTAKQLAVRALIQGFSEFWRTLSQAQRDGWKFLGDQMQRLDTQGQSYTLTGLQAFTSINMNRDVLGLAVSQDAPALDVPTNIFTLTPAAAAVAQSFEIDSNVALAATQTLVLDASDDISAGINFVPRGAFKFLKTEDDLQIPPYDVAVEWLAIYGILTEAEKIFTRAVVINDAGFAGAVIEANTIVAV